MSFTVRPILLLCAFPTMLVLGCPSSAEAVTLAPGDSAVLDGTNLPSGDIIAQSTQSVSFSSLTSTVLRDASTGKLDFIYTFNAPAQQGGTLTMTLGGLSGINVDVNYIGPPVAFGTIPTAQRNTDSLIFSEGLAEDQNLTVPSYPLLIVTNATQFTNTAPLTLDAFVDSAPGLGPGNLPPTIEVYGPASQQTGPVPEITTFSATLLGCSLWLLRGSRKLR